MSETSDSKKFSPDLTEAKEDEIFYALTMFPYPSGYGLHAGHASNYTINDVLARYQRHQGKVVFNPIGFDSFGLPTENYAMKVGKPAYEVSEENINYFIKQIAALDMSFDMERIVVTSHPDYYKWTQRIFQQLYKAGLVYRDKLWVNWCPTCQTVLANDQVVDGACERCDTEIVQKQMPQWFIKITDYADRLLEGLDDLDRPEATKKAQRNWIGRSEGAEIDFDANETTISVFTTRPDTIYGVTALVLAPENTVIDSLIDEKHKEQVESYREQTLAKTAVERQQGAQDKTGVFSGVTATHPLTGEELPIWFADYVLPDYAHGAVMLVPAHDERDFSFAQKFDIPVKEVVKPTIQIDSKTKFLQKLLKQVYDHALDHQKDVYLMGGRAFETRAGEVTRSHQDIDLMVPVGDIDFWKKFLADNGLEVIHWNNAASDYEGIVGYHPDYDKKVIEFSLLERKPENNEERDAEAIEEITAGTEKVFFEDVEVQVASIDTQLAWMKGREQVSQTAYEYIDESYEEEFFTGNGILVNSGPFSGLTSQQAKQLIVQQLISQDQGRLKITYKLRDWSVSRQRYWGSPIPVYYDDEGEHHLIPEDELPVELPLDMDDYKPKGKSPLADHPDFSTYIDKDGNEYRRECDTLDTFMCSAFYFLRYVDPHNDDALAAPELLQKCFPVDSYLGGKEHAVGHLLYSRFIHKFLYDQGYVGSPEPFQKLIHQGMIAGPDGRKMSKRRGNVIDPIEVVDEYGSDAVRTYLMFMGPIDQDKAWDNSALKGVHKFLKRVEVLLDEDFLVEANEVTDKNETLLHKTIKGVTEDMESMKYNTVVSKLMIFINAVYDVEAISHDQFRTFAVMLEPFAPKLAANIWEALGATGDISFTRWPEWDEEKVVDDEITLPIQINGKVRTNIDVSPDIEKEDALAKARAQEKIKKYIDGKEIKKVIFVPGKILNIVV